MNQQAFVNLIKSMEETLDSFGLIVGIRESASGRAIRVEFSHEEFKSAFVPPFSGEYIFHLGKAKGDGWITLNFESHLPQSATDVQLMVFSQMIPLVLTLRSKLYNMAVAALPEIEAEYFSGESTRALAEQIALIITERDNTSEIMRYLVAPIERIILNRPPEPMHGYADRLWIMRTSGYIHSDGETGRLMITPKFRDEVLTWAARLMTTPHQMTPPESLS